MAKDQKNYTDGRIKMVQVKSGIFQYKSYNKIIKRWRSLS